MSLWLTDEELYELTGYKSRTRQRAALASLGVKFRARPADGFPLVQRAQFEGSALDVRGRKVVEPDFEALGG